MGRHLDRLKKSENAQPGHHQNLQPPPPDRFCRFCRYPRTAF